MRLNPPIGVLSLVATALVAAGTFRKTEPQIGQASCDVAASYLHYLLTDSYLARSDAKIVISKVPESLLSSISKEAGNDLKNGKITDKMQAEPLIDLYQQLVRNDGISVQQACPSVANFLKSEDIAKKFAGDETISNPLDATETYKYPIIRISLPAVDLSRGEAIMVQSSVQGLLSGSGGIVYFRANKNGEWRLMFESNIWIS